MAEKSNEPTMVRLRMVRLSYPHLFKAKGFGRKNEGTPKFSATAIIDPETRSGRDNIKRLEDAIAAAKEDKWGSKIPKIKDDRICLREGDRDDDASRDMMIVAASNEARPTVLDQDGNEVTAADDVVYAGCYGDMIVRIWAQDNDYGQRVNASLEGFRFREDGEPLSSRRRVTADDFDDDDDEDDRGRGSRGRDEDDRGSRGRGRDRDEDDRGRGRGKDRDDEDDDRGRGRGRDRDEDDRGSRGRGRDRDEDDDRGSRGRSRDEDDRGSRGSRDRDEDDRGRGRGRDGDDRGGRGRDEDDRGGRGRDEDDRGGRGRGGRGRDRGETPANRRGRTSRDDIDY